MQNTSIHLPPIKKSEGIVSLAGSKSIANRILPMVAFSTKSQPWTIQNLPLGEDVSLMISALKILGTKVKVTSQTHYAIDIELFPIQKLVNQYSFLHLGNSGTCMRFLTGMLSVQSQGTFILDGVSRMRQRPISELVQAIQQWDFFQDGVRFSFLGEPNYPPLKLKSQTLQGGVTHVSGNISSQYLTGLLMAMPFSKHDVSVEVKLPLISKPYVDMTIRMLEDVSSIRIQSKEESNKIKYFLKKSEENISEVRNYNYLVEIDASSASYFLALGAISGTEKGVCIQNFPVLKTLQGEAEFLEVLIRMGAKIKYRVQKQWINQEQWGRLILKPQICDVCVSQAQLKAIHHDVETMSDTGMTLAIVALFAEGETVIRGISNWRYKETDRIEAMQAELKKLGAKVKGDHNTLKITAPKKWLETSIETYNDHRMAMCFSLACLSPVAVTILNPECSEKTYPHYFQDFQRLCQT